MLASEDYGQTWQRASLDGGGEAYFSGYVPGWQEARIDLSAFSGKKVHIALLLDTDPLASGEEAENPAGWWVDSLALATNYNTDIPTIGSVGVQPYTVLGTVPPQLELPVSVADTQRVVKVTYFLDMQPLGQVDAATSSNRWRTAPSSQCSSWVKPTCCLTSSRNSGCSTTTPRTTPARRSPSHCGFSTSAATLTPTGWSTRRTSTPSRLKLAWLPGDTGYVPFYDTDMDGVITEADANGIGYNWN